jgi:antitoxin component YwqK of YwqJK toxin-antitoxin module
MKSILSLLIYFFPLFLFSQSSRIDTSFYWQNHAIQEILIVDSIGPGNYKSQTITYHRNGTKESEINNGRPVNYWLTDGTQILKNGNGKYIYSGSDSTIYTVHDSIYDGPTISYYHFYNPRTPWKLWATGNYSNGTREGKWIFRDSSGTNDIVLTFHNNIANGPASFYYLYSGIISESGFLVECERTGEWKKFDSLGNLSGKFNYENGQKKGACTLYYPDGKIKATGQYTQVTRTMINACEDPNNPGTFLKCRNKFDAIPAKTGKWYFYSEDGKLSSTKKYRNETNKTKVAYDFYDGKGHYQKWKNYNYEMDYCGLIW